MTMLITYDATGDPYEVPNRCSVCRRKLGQNAYARIGSGGLYCSADCMERAGT